MKCYSKLVAVLWPLLPLLGSPLLLRAQVVEVSGGTSSLYQAGGGSVTVRASGLDFTVGAGTVNGEVLEGVRMVKATPRGSYTFGDNRIDFQLPTDIFDSTHYLLVRGAGFSGVRHDFDLVVFAGLLSSEYNSPLFNSAKAGDAAGMLFLKRRLNQRWMVYSDSVISQRSTTQIEAVQWSPLKKMEVAASAGVGGDNPYGAVSLSLGRPRYDLKAAYIAAGDQFERVASLAQFLAEPTRENVIATVRPFGSLILTGSHQNYLVPPERRLGETTTRSSSQCQERDR